MLKRPLWHKSMKEALRRDDDLTVTVESAADHKKEEYKHKCALEQLECQLRMEDADARVARIRHRFSEEFEGYMNRWLREEGFLATQAHRTSQSSDTRSLNIGKDLDEISGVVQRMKGNAAPDEPQMWRKQEHNPAA